jgi:hypothetical protein
MRVCPGVASSREVAAQKRRQTVYACDLSPMMAPMMSITLASRGASFVTRTLSPLNKSLRNFSLNVFANGASPFVREAPVIGTLDVLKIVARLFMRPQNTFDQRFLVRG